MNDQKLLNEIEHGKFLASQNAGKIWNWETPAGKIRWKRRVAMLTHSIKSNMHVLEIGCGTGVLSKEILHKGSSLTALDISSDLINVAKSNNADPRIEFLTGNANQMIFDDNTFDAVIGSSVLHHLEIDRSLGELYRVLKPEGFICFTEPNMMNPQVALQKNIPFLKRVCGDSPDETAFFSWSLRKKLRIRGFTSIEVVPFDFLHPGIPGRLIKSFLIPAMVAERIPVLKQIAGSLYIKAFKQ